MTATTTQKRRTRRRRFNLIEQADKLTSYQALREHFHYMMDTASIKQVYEQYVTTNYSAAEAKLILSLHDSYFTANPAMAAAVYWKSKGGSFDEPYQSYDQGVVDYLNKLLERAKKNEEEREEARRAAGINNRPKKTPIQALTDKVNSTIMTDIDSVFESWSRGEVEEDFNLLSAYLAYELKPSANTLKIVRPTLERALAEYSDAISRSCEQAVEAYSHVPMKEKRRRLAVLRSMIDDLDRLAGTAQKRRASSVKKMKGKKAALKTKKKPVDKAKIVAGIKYCSEEVDGMKSVDPTTIIDSSAVYLYNPQKRVLQVLRGGPMTASRSSVKGYDDTLSYSIKLRKPADVLPQILSKTPNQIEKILSKLSTKKGPSSGRTSDRMLILRCAK